MIVDHIYTSSVPLFGPYFMKKCKTYDVDQNSHQTIFSFYLELIYICATVYLQILSQANREIQDFVCSVSL